MRSRDKTLRYCIRMIKPLRQLYAAGACEMSVGGLYSHLFQKLTGVALGAICNFVRGSGNQYFAAASASLRSEVDQMVGDLDDVEVMFNDNDSISAVGEFVQHFQQQSDVLEVQARRWFVEDVERAARIAFGEFRSQFDALAFTSGQRGAGVVRASGIPIRLLGWLAVSGGYSECFRKIPRRR